MVTEENAFLFFCSSSFFTLRHSPSTCRVGEEEEQRVFDRCAGLETTPLFMSFLKGVSPGGVFERRKESGTGLII